VQKSLLKLVEVVDMFYIVMNCTKDVNILLFSHIIHVEQGGPINTSILSSVFSLSALFTPPNAEHISLRHFTLKQNKKSNNNIFIMK
jgi:hypothetical protein